MDIKTAIKTVKNTAKIKKIVKAANSMVVLKKQTVITANLTQHLSIGTSEN